MSSSRGARIPTVVRLLCVYPSVDAEEDKWMHESMNGWMNYCGVFVFVIAMIVRQIDR
jgi:hypothetical protein